MALDAAYSTVAEYSAQKGKLTDGDNLFVMRELAASSRLVDQICQRPPGFFNNDGDAPVARTVVVPLTDSVLLLPYPLISVTSVEVDTGPTGVYATALAPTDFELLPITGPPAPYTAIRGLSWANNALWYEGSRVRITGIWGWPEVPAAVVAATIELTAIFRIESPRATNTVDEMGQVTSISRTSRDMVERILSPYMNVAGIVG